MAVFVIMRGFAHWGLLLIGKLEERHNCRHLLQSLSEVSGTSLNVIVDLAYIMHTMAHPSYL